MAAQSKVRELRFPAGGVFRRLGFRDSADIQTVRDSGGMKSHHSTPWAVNCRPEDPIAKRLRGGSRPGLVKFCDTKLGTDITDLLALNVSSASGAETLVAAVVDDVLAVLDVGTGTVTYPTGLLETDSGADGIFNDEGTHQLLIASGSVAAPCFLVARGQMVYAISTTGVTTLDVKTGLMNTLVATAGTVPTGCTFGCVYRDRLVLAGGDNAVYMSRQGDPTDWDYGADVEDAGRAVTFQLSEAGKVGGLVTALVPHHDAYLLAATANDLWTVQGDPAASGTLRSVTSDVGIVSQAAWVETTIGLVFLGSHDLWRVGPDGGGLENLSKGKMPDELRNMDYEPATITLGWNQDEAGVYLFLSPPPDDGSHWYFDLGQAGFWPMNLQAGHQPLAAAEVENEMVVASADGYLRCFYPGNDDGTAIQSHVIIGPLPMGPPATFGRVVNLHGCLGDDSGAVTWSIVTGDTAEEAVENAKKAIGYFDGGETALYAALVKATGTLTAGRSHLVYPKIRAVWIAIWLRSTAQWAYEGITLETAESGRWR